MLCYTTQLHSTCNHKLYSHGNRIGNGNVLTDTKYHAKLHLISRSAELLFRTHYLHVESTLFPSVCRQSVHSNWSQIHVRVAISIAVCQNQIPLVPHKFFIDMSGSMYMYTVVDKELTIKFIVSDFSHL